MKGATLLLEQREREALHRLRNQAIKGPVNITGLEERIDAPGGRRRTQGKRPRRQ
jgi:hypothetical protein